MQGLNRRNAAFFLLALFGCAIVFFGGKLLAIDGRFIAGQDTLDLNYWNLLFLRKQILSGILPLWNPHVYCGQPFLANGINAVLYPPSALFWVLPVPWAFNVDVLVHIVIAGAGAGALAYAVTGSRCGSLMAALVYAFGGNMVLRLHAGHLVLFHAAAWLPWIFYFAERAFSDPRCALWTGVAFAVEILAGYLQGCVYTGIFLVLFVAMRSLLAERGSPRAWARWFTVPAVAVGLAAVALLPAYELLSRSNRAVGSYAFATRLSFPPQNFLTLLLPYTDSSTLSFEFDYGCYVGVLPLVLIVAAILWWPRRQMLPWLILSAVALTFALGSFTPLYRLYVLIPFVQQMRVPARALFVLVLFFSVLAGMGADLVVRGLGKRNHLLFAGCATAVVLTTVLLGAHALHIPASALIRSYIAVTLSLGVLLVVPFVRRNDLVQAAMVACVFADLAIVGAPWIPTTRFSDVMAKTDYEELIAKDRSDYRVLFPIGFSQKNMSLASRCSVFGCYNAGGYVPGGTEDYYDFLHAMADLPVPTWTQHTPDLGLFASPKALFSSRILGIKYGIVLGAQENRLVATNKLLPRALLVHRAAVVPQYREHLAILKDAAFDPRTTVLLESDPGNHAAELQETDASADRAEITSYRPNDLDVQTSSSASAFLLLSELYYPGWYAWIDGEPAPIVRADYLLRAIPLAPGQHRVRLEFRPDSLKLGTAISASTLGVLALVWLRSRRRQSLRAGNTTGAS